MRRTCKHRVEPCVTRRMHELASHRLVAVAMAGFVIVGVGLAPSDAGACHPTTACFHYVADFHDDDIGETVPLGNLVRAVGARVTIVRTAPETPIVTTLDDEGCVTFDTQFSYGHKAILHADAIVGGVRIRPSLTATDPTDWDFPVEYEPYIWEVHLHGLAEGDTTDVLVLNEVGLDPLDPAGRALPMMASATATLQRFVDLDIMPPDLDPNAEIALIYRADELNASCFCDGNALERVRIGADSFREKFVMAHELGHWLHANHNGSLGAGSYFYPPGEMNQPYDLACQFDAAPFIDEDGHLVVDEGGDASLHGIRSAEYSGAALKEGYAQFIASVTWNDPALEDGVFRYYKDVSEEYTGPGDPYEDFVAMGSRIALVGGAPESTLGGRSAWVKNECPTDFAYDDPATEPVDEIVNEMDWMRFFWRFTTDQGSAAPTLSQVVGFLVYIQANHPWAEASVFPSFVDAIAGAPGMAGFEPRMLGIANTEGVDGD
jgi:hypothetical protein